MNKNAVFPIMLVWFLVVVLFAGWLTMAWLPNHLATWFNIAISTAQIIGLVILLGVLGLFKFIGVI